MRGFFLFSKGFGFPINILSTNPRSIIMQYSLARCSAVLLLLLTGTLTTACGEDEAPATNLDRIDLRLLEPAADDTVDATMPIDFTWAYSEPPNGQFRRWLELSTSPDFGERETTLSTGNGYQSGELLAQFRKMVSTPPGQTDLPTTWYWRVRLSISNAMVTPWTEPRRFYVAE